MRGSKKFIITEEMELKEEMRHDLPPSELDTFPSKERVENASPVLIALLKNKPVTRLDKKKLPELREFKIVAQAGM